MPKIIENIREQLLNEAKKQIVERGYAGTTVRSVASACGVGVGTVYNYFPSKDMLIASFVAEDWMRHLNKLSALPTDNAEMLLQEIYDSLRSFAENNKSLFSDTDAAKAIPTGFATRHKLLREQIAQFVIPICRDERFADKKFAAEFISESLISWAMENKSFNSVYAVLQHLF